MWYEMIQTAVFAALLWGAWRLGVHDGRGLGAAVKPEKPQQPAPQTVQRAVVPAVMPDRPGDEAADAKTMERLKEIDEYEGWPR